MAGYSLNLPIELKQKGLSINQIALEYGIAEKQVNESLAFYADRRAEIDDAIASEQNLELIELQTTTIE